ncbi:MAG: hypothetical protein ACRD42_03730 [Nitrososphaeraceae archaeon]
MKEKTIAIATVLAATMLMAAFAVIPAEASQDSYLVIPVEASQDSYLDNDCGNGFEPESVFCQGLTSQIIGYDNDITIDGDQ